MTGLVKHARVETYTITYRPSTGGDTLTNILTAANAGAAEIDFNAIAVN